METANTVRTGRPTSWAHVVITLFQGVAEDCDFMIRPAMVPFDSPDPGTVVSLIRYESDGVTWRIEDIYTPCDFETFSKLARAYQRQVNTHVVTGDRFSLFAYNKANLKKADSKSVAVA
ncbi:MAG TPA: hypothetical protein VN397_04095 [Candidatus Methylomirabilis sp.]|nr:hypothetical protein [Candidatus Methylomirabilis sp.]